MKGKGKKRTVSPEGTGPEISGPDDLVRAAFKDDLVSHRLLGTGTSMIHEWSSIVKGEEVPILAMKGNDLLESILYQIDRLSDGNDPESDLIYQRFAGWDDDVLDDFLENDIGIGVMRETDEAKIRITTGERRYEMQYLIHPWSDLTPVYMISRLNSVGFPNVVDELGIGYWSVDARNVPWMSLIRYPEGSVSGFSPFLSDLNDLLTSAIPLDGENIRELLRRSARDLPGHSMEMSGRIGKAIGRMHGSLILDHPSKKGGKKGEGTRITDLFSRSSFDMQDIGSLLGMFSGYMDDVRKGLYRKLGDDIPPITLSHGRKQKVVKRKSRERVSDLPTLSLLRGALLSKHEEMRSRFALIRRFRGSPMIPSGIDTSLDMIMLDRSQEPIFKSFDWSLFDIEGNHPGKILPLKDLALILSSLVKARYLAARKVFSSLTGSRSNEQLEMMFLEYNISKDGYLSMVSDLNAVYLSRRKDAPFRYVVISSIISSLWYERCRNALIQGYNEGLSGTSEEDLLVYPGSVDTLEGIRLMQMITSLSSASEKLSREERSLVSLESDLLTALSV